jgi:hypothetical protein
VATAEHPNAPRRSALALAFAGIVLAGVLGGLIGWGIVDTTCNEQPTVAEELLAGVPGHDVRHQECDARLLGAALAGSVLATAGSGVVAVLMLRAQSEWRAHPPRPLTAAQRAELARRRARSGGTPPRT